MRNNFPKDDVWYLPDKNYESQNYETNYKFDFSYISSSDIKALVKHYIWSNYRTDNRSTRGLLERLLKFKYFEAFCKQANITMLESLDNCAVESYRVFLRSQISKSTCKPLSYSYQKGCFDTLKALINWCRIFMSKNVPAKEIFTGNEYRGVHKCLKIDFIPDDVLHKINLKLRDEENPYLKYGFVILETTGMRIGDLVLLHDDCVKEHPITGYCISWYDHKNHNERDSIPIPCECYNAVRALISLTSDLRLKACENEKNRLFIYSPKIGTNKKVIVTVSRQVFSKWCREFTVKHNIVNTDGVPYTLTTRMFRRTLATDMLSKGTNIKVIQEALGHASVTTTKLYYADIKDASRAKMFGEIGIIGNIRDTGNLDEIRKCWLEENCNGKARLSDGYCTLPLQNGTICSQLLNKQKCYTCSRYITTLDDLETHKSHLKELQALIEANIYGEHYAAHIIPTIAGLKEIIQRLGGTAIWLRESLGKQLSSRFLT